MSLLFDQNLSFALVGRLADLYPAAAHLRDLGLASADDGTVWTFAKANGFVIVSKDADFRQRSFLYGHPPNVISLCLGNCTTNRVADLLRARHRDVEAFLLDPTASLLILS